MWGLRSVFSLAVLLFCLLMHCMNSTQWPSCVSCCLQCCSWEDRLRNCWGPTAQWGGNKLHQPALAVISAGNQSQSCYFSSCQLKILGFFFFLHTSVPSRNVSSGEGECASTVDNGFFNAPDWSWGSFYLQMSALYHEKGGKTRGSQLFSCLASCSLRYYWTRQQCWCSQNLVTQIELHSQARNYRHWEQKEKEAIMSFLAALRCISEAKQLGCISWHYRKHRGSRGAVKFVSKCLSALFCIWAPHCCT